MDADGAINWEGGKQLLAEVSFDFPVRKGHLETFKAKVNVHSQLAKRNLNWYSREY